MSRREVSCCQKNSGMTLIEIVVAMAVLATILCALVSVLMSASKLDTLTRERGAAANAVVKMAELMRNRNFANVYDDYSPGGFTGNTFSVHDLQGDFDPPVGTITFFVDETDTSTDGKMLGLPMDLDGDGAVNTVDVSASHVLLPIKLNITWHGATGLVSLNFYFLLAQAYID